MSDDLVKRLRAADEYLPLGHDGWEAADRIEELEAERDDYAFKLVEANNTYSEMHVAMSEANDKLATCEKYRDAYAEMGRIGTDAVRDLEAKLAEAVDALASVLDACDKGRMMPRPGCGAGGMTIEANIKGSIYTGVPAWPIEEARTTLEELKADQ